MSSHQTGGKPTNQAFSMPAAGGALATGQSHGSYCVGEVGGKVIRTNVQQELACVASEICSEMFVRAGERGQVLALEADVELAASRF